MRIIFLGSGSFGLPTIQRLYETHELAAVITQPDRPAGRRRRLAATPIAQWTANTAVPIFKTADVNSPDLIENIKQLRPNGGVVVAFGQKLDTQLVHALGDPVINLHGSLLPKYRGSAPINWAIVHGERTTGVSVISIAPRMDSGLIYGQKVTPIDPLETAGELHDRLAQFGPDVILQTLTDFEKGDLTGEVQDESEVSRAPKLTKSNGRVDFGEPSDRVRGRIHGFTPWPSVRVLWIRKKDRQEQELLLRRVQSDEAQETDQPPGTLLDNQTVATGRGVIRLLEVQRPGRRPMLIDEFVRGHPFQAGDVLV